MLQPSTLTGDQKKMHKAMSSGDLGKADSLRKTSHTDGRYADCGPVTVTVTLNVDRIHFVIPAPISIDIVQTAFILWTEQDDCAKQTLVWLHIPTSLFSFLCAHVFVSVSVPVCVCVCVCACACPFVCSWQGAGKDALLDEDEAGR